MHGKLIYRICIAAVLIIGGTVQAAVFTDNFDTARDYLTEGVEGTGWDGFLGQAPGQTVSALNASMDSPGALYMASAAAYWADPWNPLGPFLYKVVEGDFVATVRVSDYATGVYYNNCGLMARVANLADAGAGEDWISIDYFPLYGVGNIVRYAENNARSEDVGGNGTGDNGHRWLQLERVGNTFYLRTSADGVNWTDYPDASFTGLNRSDLDGLPVQVGIQQATFTSASGYVAFDDFSVSGDMVIVANKAFNPRPRSKDTELPRETVLTWTPAEGAAAHDVYFGTEDADVLLATRANPLDVLAKQAQDANMYDPGLLTFGQTYYWRVDEVQADGVTVHRGDIWTFTVQPFAYPITGVKATASSANSKDTGPEKTVDGSGLTDDLHSSDSKAMWLSKRGGPQPTWIQYEFDKAYKLHEMWVWNSNQIVELDFGLGARNVTIEYSADGSTWTALGEFEFDQAIGEDDCPPMQSPVDFKGAVAKYVKLTINSNWGDMIVQYGLSEVRFYYVPVWPKGFVPAGGAADVHPQVTLSWVPGREAASHQVYLSTDQQAVIDETAPPITVFEPVCEVAADLASEYFWKVVEVNDVHTPASWASDVLSFSTAGFIVVDDFEKYGNLPPDRVFQTWIDGAGFSPDEFFPNGHSGNGSGSFAGYDPQTRDVMEMDIIHGGMQSMPVYYDNSGGTRYSEVQRTFVEPQDWSKHGVTTLVIWFRGQFENVPAPLYAKINGVKVPYDGGAPSTAFPVWKQWNIDLASAGVNLSSIQSLTLGVGDGFSGGAGTLFIDDLLLYATPPQAVTAVDPGTNGLAALYTMEGSVQDSSGKGLHGTASGDPGYDQSVTGYGKALYFDGVSDYVGLPIGPLIKSLTSTTVATWVNFTNTGGDWQRIFDFGTGTDAYMFLCPRMGATGGIRFAIKPSGAGETTMNVSATLPTGWHHVAVVIDGAAMTMQLYVDGTLAASRATGVLPRDLGETTQNWLGRSQYTADGYFSGALDDVRIYNRALSQSEVLYLAGDR